VRRTAPFATALLLCASSARTAGAAPLAPADPLPGAEPPVAVAVVAGLATTLLPLVIGVGFVAGQGQTAATDGQRNVGFAVSGVGPALGPIVAHVVLGEWARAAAFGAAPVAAEVGLCAYVKAMPDSVFQGTAGTRLGFGLLYSADIFGAALGIVDVMMARERWRQERRGAGVLGGLRVAPRVSADHVGIVVGGAL
jgi:hypothetical protein